jgi:hypothetical protein
LHWVAPLLQRQRKQDESLHGKEVKLFEFTFFVAQMERAKPVIEKRLFGQTLVAYILNHITFTASLTAGRMHPNLSPLSVPIATAKFITA